MIVKSRERWPRGLGINVVLVRLAWVACLLLQMIDLALSDEQVSSCPLAIGVMITHTILTILPATHGVHLLEGSEVPGKILLIHLR